MGRQIGEEGEVTEWPRRRKLSLSFLKKSHEGQARFQVHLLSSILERGFLYNGIFLVMLPHRESWSSKRKQRKKAEKVRLAKRKDVLNHLIFLFVSFKLQWQSTVSSLISSLMSLLAHLLASSGRLMSLYFSQTWVSTERLSNFQVNCSCRDKRLCFCNWKWECQVSTSSIDDMQLRFPWSLVCLLKVCRIEKRNRKKEASNFLIPLPHFFRIRTFARTSSSPNSLSSCRPSWTFVLVNILLPFRSCRWSQDVLSSFVFFVKHLHSRKGK